MREAMFIKKNREKWKKYQEEKASSPDETAERFITLIDDLAYAKTFYPKSQLTEWVNGVAASIYQTIYRNKKEKYSRVIDFWKYELPLIFQKYHRILLFTLISFSLFVALGVFASIQNPGFIRDVLGNPYVDMTEDNIAKGDPFGVYKDDNKFAMFIGIAFNNIRVAFFTFIGGFTLGISTLYILWSNGIMLGCFQFLFFSQGLGFQSILVVWIHGTIEIFSIVIAGTAGFMIAKSIIFPGTYTRLVSFKQGIKDAAKLLICLIPFFIAAAFLESYITHLMSETYNKKTGAGMPVWLSVLILLSSLWLMAWYFVLWPLKLRRRSMHHKQFSPVKHIHV